MRNTKDHWVVVLDDSNCTVGVGGEGYIWRVTECSWNTACYKLEGVPSPYHKYIFRDATNGEIEDWIKYKKRALVPKHGKEKLYEGIFTNIDDTLNALLKKKLT